VSEKPTILLTSRETRQRAASWALNAPPGTIVEFRQPKRTVDQNARLWALLTDVARQIEWAGRKRTTEAWKDIFTAALRSAKHELDVVPGIEGGFVLLGMHTSSMSKAEMIDLQTLIEEWGARNGVMFSDLEPGAGERDTKEAAQPSAT